MIKVKTADNVLTDVSEIYIKTSENALTKIAEGYQVVSVNGEKRLIPVFLSECKHDWVVVYYNPSSCVSDEYWEYQCSKCLETYTEYGEFATGHEWDPDTGSCYNCGESCIHEHYGTRTEEVTPHCTEILTQAVYCDNCGYIVGEGYVDPVGHDFDPDTGLCRRCGESRPTCECYDQIPDESGQVCLNCGGFIA